MHLFLLLNSSELKLRGVLLTFIPPPVLCSISFNLLQGCIMYSIHFLCILFYFLSTTSFFPTIFFLLFAFKLLLPALPSTYIYTQGDPLFCLYNTQSFEGMEKAGCLGPQLPPHSIQTAPFTCDLLFALSIHFNLLHSSNAACFFLIQFSSLISVRLCSFYLIYIYLIIISVGVFLALLPSKCHSICAQEKMRGHLLKVCWLPVSLMIGNIASI